MDERIPPAAETQVEKRSQLLDDSQLENRFTNAFAEMELAIQSISNRFSTNALTRTSSSELKPLSTTSIACRCPRCNQQGQKRDKPDARLVQILRGQIGWSEGEFFCGKCRKSFFPVPSRTGT